MASPSIVLPTENLNQERRCNKHKGSRYCKLIWEHLTVPIEDAKDAVNTALPYPFYGGFICIAITSLDDAFHCPYNGLYWDETQGVFLDRSLEILVDTGVTKNCAAGSCGQPDLAIPLGGQNPRMETFRTSGWHFYNVNGIRIEDRDTVFNRVYDAQVDLDKVAEEKFGKPIVKKVL